jgi:hypothetical protein
MASENRADKEAVDGDTGSILDIWSVLNSNEDSALNKYTTDYVLSSGGGSNVFSEVETKYITNEAAPLL